MEWISELPERLQDAIWYGAFIGAALVVFAIGYRRAGPLLKAPIETPSLARLDSDKREYVDKLEEIIGGLRQVCASIDAHSRRMVEEYGRLSRQMDELIRHQRDR